MTTTPTQWLPLTQVNLDTAEGRVVFDERVVGLSNGNFLVTYSELSRTNDEIPDLPFAVRGVLYDAQGNVLNDDLDLSQTDSDLNASGGGNTQVVADDAGGFYILYEQNLDDRDSLIVERFDASGALIANTVAAGPTEVGGFFSSDATLAIDTNGNLHVSYIPTDPSSDLEQTLMIILDSDLNPIAGTAAEGLILFPDPDPTDDETFASVEEAALANGNVAYVTNGIDGGISVDLRIVDSTTGAVITELEVRAPQGGRIAMRDEHVETLSDGSFVVVWREFVNDGSRADQKILSVRFDVDGVQIGAVRVLDLPDRQDSFVIEEVLALDDGGYFVLTYDRFGDEAIQGTRFDADGNVVGETMATLVANISGFKRPEASLTSDGRILITYEDENDEVLVTIFDPRDTTINAEVGDGQITARLDEDTTINGTDDGETLLGQNGNDTLNGNDGDDQLFGGAGNDDLNGGGNNDLLNGDGGNDALNGAGGNDTIIGGTGRDELIGGGGNDTLFGGDDNDIVRGGVGADSMSGGTGSDTLSYTSDTTGVSVNLNANTASGGNATGDTIASFENVEGGSGDNTLIGTISDNAIISRGGNDSLFGLDGDDRLAGGGGDDLLRGDGGGDTLNGGGGIDTLSYGTDTIGVNVDIGLNDASGGDATGDIISGFENLIGGTGDDILKGTGGDNEIKGGSGNDRLSGRTGEDVLIGGAGTDTLNGGEGNDTLTGGGAADVFIFSGTTDDDTITDFQVGIDTLKIYGQVEADVSFSNAGGGDTLITLASGDTILVENTSIADLNTFDDFQFV